MQGLRLWGVRFSEGRTSTPRTGWGLLTHDAEGSYMQLHLKLSPFILASVGCHWGIFKKTPCQSWAFRRPGRGLSGKAR